MTAPGLTWLPGLERHNDDLIATHHPLRETLMLQTGASSADRHQFLTYAYLRATEAIPSVWPPPR